MLKRLSFIFFLISLNIHAESSYQKIKEQRVLPKTIQKAERAEQNAWIIKQLETTTSQDSRYLLNRTLFLNHFNAQQFEPATGVCTANQPRKDDYRFRAWCNQLILEDYQEYVASMYALAQEAREAEFIAETINALADIGWRQSQNGDIAEAFSTYQEAMTLAPKENKTLLFATMFDTATVYIIHGDDDYVNKGVGILQEIQQSSHLSMQSLDKNSIEYQEHQANAILASFNIGIAYTLHLHNYAKALPHFDYVLNANQNYQLEALSFAALAAAEINQKVASLKYLAKIDQRHSPDAVVDIYLQCYQALANRHWNASVPLTPCLNMHPTTSIEVTLDIYQRLAKLVDSPEELLGLRKLRQLFNQKILPELKRQSSKAASNTELQRLAVESELKSEILQKERALQQSTQSEKETQTKLFTAISLVLFLLILLAVSQLRQKLKLAKQFEKMSLRDSLTQLGNRRYLEQHIERETGFIDRHYTDETGPVLAFYLMDIDRFKRINDTYGHHAGDAILVEFSQRIKTAIRDTDLLIRWGGEEFLLVARLGSTAELKEIANRLLKTISAELYPLPGHTPIKVTATIGALPYPFLPMPDKAISWHQLISIADLGLYWGKTHHRNCWVIINNQQIDTEEKLQALLQNPLETSLKESSVCISSSFEQ